MDILLYALINSVIDKVDIPKITKILIWETWKSGYRYISKYTWYGVCKRRMYYKSKTSTEYVRHI